jgi:hypothetical protein
MLLSLSPNWWEDWELYHKVVFDGINRLIIITPNASSISVKTDIYSAWKEWLSLRDNAKFLPAIRTTGGDPTGNSQYTGDVYFLINNWRILVDHSCDVDGVIYSDDFPSPFIQQEGTQIVTNKVSALVNIVSTSGTVGGDVPTASEVANAVWTNTSRTLTQTPTYNGPSVVQIRQELDTNSSKLQQLVTNTQSIPSANTIADAVRVELTPELTKIMTLENNPGLTVSQATMLAELYAIMGLDPTKPLIVTQNQRTAGAGINQNITTSQTQTTVTRNV